MALDWLDDRRAEMLECVRRWSRVNTGTGNTEGLFALSELLEKDFAPLEAGFERRALPSEMVLQPNGTLVAQPHGPLLIWRKRPLAKKQVLLCIHYDTVYSREHPFQTVEDIDDDRLRGPGVADAKGGIAILLFALLAFERSARAGSLGWTVALNPDEEVGSPVSTDSLLELARPCSFGLLYEPSLPDGSLVSDRKGSGNFACVIRGRAAHAGREFEQGRSALFAAARFVTALEAQNRTPGVTVNVGRIEGGGALNVVPDLAIVRFNARVEQIEQARHLKQTCHELVTDINAQDGFTAELHGDFSSPPKHMTPKSRELFDLVLECARAEGLAPELRKTGGACDGNRLHAAGLPNVDTLGARGDFIHSEREFLIVPSLVERARLSARILLSADRTA